MMGRSLDGSTLRNIVAVRALQKQASEMALHAAADRADAADRTRTESAKRLESCEASWRQSLIGDRLDPAMLSQHGQAILYASDALAVDDRASAEAAAYRVRQQDALVIADAQLEAAEALHKEAGRSIRRKREAAQLDEIADQFARRRNGR